MLMDVVTFENAPYNGNEANMMLGRDSKDVINGAGYELDDIAKLGTSGASIAVQPQVIESEWLAFILTYTWPLLDDAELDLLDVQKFSLKFECPDVNSFSLEDWNTFRDETSKDEVIETTFIIGSLEEEHSYSQPILSVCTQLQTNNLQYATLRSSTGSDSNITEE